EALAEGDPLVQRRCTLVKGTVRHCPRLHPQARGTGVLRAMIKSNSQPDYAYNLRRCWQADRRSKIRDDNRSVLLGGRSLFEVMAS
ncbi:hypothetical protein, partial [Phormidesmis priestleyi]